MEVGATSSYEKQPEIIASLDRSSGEFATNGALSRDDETKDDRLRLIFDCCHPLLGWDDQTALALKTLWGFSPAKIANACLTTETAVYKRLTRARQKIRELGLPIDIPAGPELA